MKGGLVAPQMAIPAFRPRFIFSTKLLQYTQHMNEIIFYRWIEWLVRDGHCEGTINPA